MSDVAQPVFNVPQRRSWAAARSIPASGVDRLVVRCLTIDLVMLILMQKIAVPISGESQIETVVFPHFAVLATLAYYGRLHLSTPRVLMLMLSFGIALVGQSANSGSPGWLSFGLLIFCYFWMPFVVRANRATYTTFMRNLVVLSMAASALTYFDHLCQIAGFGMPDMDSMMPFPWIFNNYVYVQPIFWGSRFMKPNGFFFLEVSHLSQFIALGLIVELTLFRRLSRVLILGSALMVTFAGTGLLLMLLCAPFLAVKLLKPKVILAGCVALPLLLGVAAVSGWFDALAYRSGELDKSNSSANGRFVLPYQEAFNKFFTGTTEQILIGNGAGNSERSQYLLQNVLTKSFQEYGLVFTVAFVGFMLYVIFGAGVPIAISWAALVLYQFLNGALLIPLTIIEVYLLCGAFQLEPEPRARRPQRVAQQSALLGPAGGGAAPQAGVFG